MFKRFAKGVGIFALGSAAGLAASATNVLKKKKKESDDYKISVTGLRPKGNNNDETLFIDSGSKSRKIVGVLELRGTFRAPPVKGGAPWSGQSGGIDGDMVASCMARLVQASESFENPLSAVVLRIDSPGGSPLEASKVYSALKHYKAKLGPATPLIVVVESLCASAGYYAAAAADEIVCDPNSIIGSIGVISAPSINVHKFLEANGIEGKILTSGANKFRMDPFAPSKHEDELFIRMLMGDIHANFISVVKAERGDRLKPGIAAGQLAKLNGTRAEDEDGLFDGCAYAGQRAVDVGFADTLTSAPLNLWLQERFGEDVAICKIEKKKVGKIQQLLGMGLFGLPPAAAMAGSGSVVDDAFRLARDYALYSRFGMSPPR